MNSCKCYNYNEFQLTRSRGARQLTVRTVAVLDNFNSRAHVERDAFGDVR